MPNEVIRFRLDLSYEKYLAFYEGIAKRVSVVADDGRRVEFPAGNIRRFLTRTGIHGHFEMELTEQMKFVSLKKLE